METEFDADRARVAVVEDDEELREHILIPELAHAGFDVVGMGGALDLYRAMTVRSFDLVVLDVQLPDENGYAIARHLRTLSPSLGIVMLTGYGSDRDHLRALDDGVDAYLFKPADIEKLAATLRNLMRRVGSAPATVNLQGRWRLADNGWRIVSPGDVEVGINLAERQVMRVLAASPGVPVRREVLIARLAEDVHDFDPHRLEMLVYRLRKKCQKAAQEELPLSAVRGVGYVLTW